MKILLITNGLPYPPTHGGKVRAWQLLQQIAQHHEVTLLSLLDSAEDIQFVAHLQQHCARVETVIKQRRRSRKKLFLRLFKTMLKGQPPRNGITYYEEMEDKIKEIICNHKFDIIQIEQSSMAPYIEFIKPTDAAHLINLYDAGATQLKRISQIHSNLQERLWAWLDCFFLDRWEPTYLAKHFDKCLVVSAVDKALLQQINPALDLEVIPNGVDTVQNSLLPEAAESKTILFVGNMGYEPNVDGAVYFCQEIFPLIKQQIREAKVFLVGSTPSKMVRDLASDDVVVTGSVESVLPYYQQALISIVPLRAGGGTRLKILESMALGRPVISTTLGCEGLAVSHRENILIADTPADFARQTIQLLNDQELRQRLISNGRQLVERMYDWQTIAQRLFQVYREVCNQESVEGVYIG